MPWSVRLAVLCASLLTLLGAFSVVAWTVDLLNDEAATRWISEHIGVRGGSSRILLNPLYLQAAALLPATFRREPRARELGVQLSLLAAILLGFLAVAAVVTAVFEREVDARFGGVLASFALVATLSWSLSRPSAREWFAPPGA